MTVCWVRSVGALDSSLTCWSVHWHAGQFIDVLGSSFAFGPVHLHVGQLVDLLQFGLFVDGFEFWSVHSHFKLFFDRQFLPSHPCGFWSQWRKGTRVFYCSFLSKKLCHTSEYIPCIIGSWYPDHPFWLTLGILNWPMRILFFAKTYWLKPSICIMFNLLFTQLSPHDHTVETGSSRWWLCSQNP